MFFTGSNSLNNALALENRQYGYEDENLGILSKTTSNDSTWSKIANETFVETTPKWKSLANLVEYTYTYINAKSVSTDKILSGFYKVLNYLEDFGVKKFFGEVALKVIRNGCYYGYLIR